MPTIPLQYANDHVTTLRASMTSKTQTSGIIGNPLEHNGETAPDVLWQITGPQILRFSKGKFVEYIYFATASVDADTGVITYGTATRDITWKDGASITQLTTGVKKWTAGTVVELVWSAHQAENVPYKDQANSFVGLQTFTEGIDVTGKYVKLPVFADATARDAAIASPSNGMLCYNTGTGTVQQYVAGAWASIGTDATANASATVAGKVEIATAAERAAATATGGTGALLVPSNDAFVKTSAGAGDENKVPLLGSSGTLAVGFLGTGSPSASNYLLGSGAFGTVATTYFDRTVGINTTDSSTRGASSTADFLFDNHTLNIDANDLVAGAGREFEAIIALTWAAGDIEIAALLGSTKVLTFGDLTPAASGEFIIIRGQVFGTQSAAASATVKAMGDILVGSTANFKHFGKFQSTGSIATNGSLTLQFGGAFRTSNGGNNMIMKLSHFRKISTTAA